MKWGTHNQTRLTTTTTRHCQGQGSPNQFINQIVQNFHNKHTYRCNKSRIRNKTKKWNLTMIQIHTTREDRSRGILMTKISCKYLIFSIESNFASFIELKSTVKHGTEILMDCLTTRKSRRWHMTSMWGTKDVSYYIINRKLI